MTEVTAKKHMAKKVLLALALIVIVGGVAAWFVFDPVTRWRDARATKEQQEIVSSFENTVPVAAPETSHVNLEPVDNEPTQVETKPSETSQLVELKERVLLDVQFIPQGPLDPGAAHWALHKESCEEAAMLMAHNYSLGRTVTMQQANDEIFELVDWQVQNFGDEHDIYADEVSQVLEGFYGHSDVRVIQDATIDQIKAQLSAGYPVIVPSIAKYLKNPRYYDQDYHMFLLVGYTADRIIAHDNGTTWGDNYPYPYDDILQAITSAGGDVIVIGR
jgi:hypothetical protein